MPFSELQKRLIRKAGDYACCVCRERIGVDIHHLIPEGEDGPSTLDNAAPLCSKCHDLLGPNPSKRKYIRECRDHWFEQCAAKDPAVLQKAFLNQIDGLSESVREIIQKEINTAKELFQRTPSESENDSEGQKLSFADLIRFIYSVPVYGGSFEQVPASLISFSSELFLSEKTWRLLGEEETEIKNKFLNIFGEQTAKRILLWVLSTDGFKFDDFTGPECDRSLNRLLVEMIVLSFHEDLGGDVQISFTLKGEEMFIRLTKPDP